MYGTHAKFVLIRSFAQALADHGPPIIVEVFLSRSLAVSGRRSRSALLPILLGAATS